MTITIQFKAAEGSVIAGAYCPICEILGSQKGDEAPFECRGEETDEFHAPVLLSWPWSSEEEYEAWYADPFAYHVDEQAANGQQACDEYERYAAAYQASRFRFRILNALTNKGCQEAKTLLDIGAGNMACVDIAYPSGYEAHGIDPHPLRVDCLQGTWRDVTRQWDVLTMHDVFEHLTRPRECLRHLRKCLSPGGVLVIEQPEWDSPHQRKYGMAWRHIRPRQHICLYSRGAAEQMYAEEGYEVIAFHRPLRGKLGKMTHYLQRPERDDAA